MKRNKFLTVLLASFTLPAMAYKASKSFLSGGIGFKVKAGEGRKHGHITLKGVNANIMDMKISGSDTDGGILVLEQTSITQGKGTPLHVHPMQNEFFYVVEGAYYFQVGDEKFNVTAGETVFLPQNVPHAWTQMSEKGKMLVTFQPAGKMEDFFITISGLDHVPGQDEMAKIFADHEMKIVGGPVSPK